MRGEVRLENTSLRLVRRQKLLEHFGIACAHLRPRPADHAAEQNSAFVLILYVCEVNINIRSEPIQQLVQPLQQPPFACFA